MNIFEGGNVFKDGDGRALTQRINQTDVAPTVMWLEMLTGLDLRGENDEHGFPEKWLGSTGKKPTSGDLDLEIDANQLTKEQLVNRLVQWVQSHGFKPEDYVRKTGSIVHFKTPITGRPDSGYVQTDFTFLKKPQWSRFILTSDPNSKYKGALRNIMLNSIAKSMGYKLNQIDGIADRATNQIISDDPDKVAKLLLNNAATRADLYSVEAIMRALARDPKKDAKIADFRAHMEREGEPFFESADTLYHEYNETNFLARLRDRIVNQGMRPLVESAKDVRIEHLEDLVFEKGSRGIREALQIIADAAADTASTTTVKWDGKPAIIFGRKPTGEFVLTDKSGFLAKGYDGLATSPEQIARIMNQRGGERGDLIAIYVKLWPLLSAAVPANFQGYIQGDLLYTETPPEIAGAYVFRPNFIEYKIPATSNLGQQIGNSEVGVAIHTRIADPMSPAEPLGDVKLRPVPGLLLITPNVKEIQNVHPNAKLVAELKQLLREKGPAINQLFSPIDLRSHGITDLPALCKRYINSRITSNFDNLLPEFGNWLKANVTPRKFNNIVEYLQSPRSNIDGISAAFTAFLGLHDLKSDLLQQLDRQQPGQEGWVLATPAGRAKLVNRFGFSAGNRALNNPELIS